MSPGDRLIAMFHHFFFSLLAYRRDHFHSTHTTSEDLVQDACFDIPVSLST